MSRDLPPVRLSLRPPGGQGQPYGDDVVELARELVETTTLTNSAIADRVGVSHMTIARWARSGNWRQPYGRRNTRRPWRLLEEAENRLGELERAGTAELRALAEMLVLLLAARHLGRALAGSRRPRRRASAEPPSAPC